MVTETGASGATAQVRVSQPSVWGSVKRALALVWWLAAETARICLRYRVTGLAAEVGFFALLSLPPLVLGLVGSIGFVGDLMGDEAVADLRQRLRELTLTFLTADSVSSVILPTFDQVIGGGRADIVSIGFVLSLWSGSRVLNVYLDTASIMYGLGGLRGIVRARVLSFSLYCLALVVGIVLIPLVLIGPSWLGKVLYGAGFETLGDIGGSDWIYWPVVSIAAVTGITGLYHLATPIRSRFYRDLPGSVLALTIWVLASFVLRWTLDESVGGTSIYGPLATPIVILIWLYALAIALLIGAALNAAVDELWPIQARVEARARVLAKQSDDRGSRDAQPATLTPLAPATPASAVPVPTPPVAASLVPTPAAPWQDVPEPRPEVAGVPARPDAPEPNAPEPDAAEPDAAEPDAAEPDAAEPTRESRVAVNRVDLDRVDLDRADLDRAPLAGPGLLPAADLEPLVLDPADDSGDRSR
ncbi:YihY/virulence factor BrkB family protein [Kineosporia succinea]|uniref:Membrane protein n=1 Tax=Kineosporia succinea TaxID=84632 RepID=A0ABT9NW22_9ACTN|nr:YihY/virulence factor BrkB family protein [Kineosporia succinea]MDP9824477.1 membrane protein [Kineosporia succinea]